MNKVEIARALVRAEKEWIERIEELAKALGGEAYYDSNWEEFIIEAPEVPEEIRKVMKDSRVLFRETGR